MKVTKNILREMIEAEINLLNEVNLSRMSNDIDDVFIDPDVEAGDLRLKQEYSTSEGKASLRAQVDEWIDKDVKEPSEYSMTSRRNYARNIRTKIQRIDFLLSEEGLSYGDTSEPSSEEETPGETEASSSDSVAAQEGGETDLSAESTAMLTTMKTQGGILKRGSSGSKVGLLQDALRARLGTMSHQWLGVAGESDSDFGGKTKAAVEAIQTKYGITKDGVVGPNTAASLLADAAATGTAPARSRSAPSADGEPAAQETYASLNPFGNDIGMWNPDAKVWFATNWARASTASKDAGYNTAIKLENEDGVRYVRKAGDALTEDDINELLDDDGAPTEADVNPIGSDSATIVANEAVNYFKRFTRDLNEIDSMRDDRSFTDIMATEEAEEEAPAEEEARMSDDLIVLKVELRGFNEIANLTDSELDTALRTIDGMTIQEFEPLRRQAYRELNVAYKTKVSDLLKSISGFPENKIDSFSANVHRFVDIEKDDDDSKISVTKISSHWPRSIYPDTDWYNGIDNKIAFFYAERGRLAPRVNVELFDKTIDVVGVSQFIVVRDALRKIKQFINENQDASAGGGTAAQGTEDAPTVDNANLLPGQSAAVQQESLSYDRFSKLAGILLD